ncbi:hypothetical protein ATY77_30180 [Rhizobium sp. R634]|uniref:hypothetical protein n=1 Tax=Rhizobium sp. R634 TaxID=1764274 RepID=UPI000B537CFC|nr:hypothetical protein [Rhizobium sp. R634]OWV77640.1 hypothetical protein ATY77_30180 [Rhizobium sp. R634]
METLPEAKIPTTGGPGTKAAGAGEHAEQPASDLLPAGAGAEATARPVPEPTKPTIPPLGTDAAAAGIVIRSSNEDPDQVASDLRLAEDYAGATGGPVPPLALVKQYRDSFRQTLQEAQNAKILSQAPVLANWLLSPENTALAGDDVATLAYFERLGGPPGNMAKADGSSVGRPPAAQPNGSTPAPPEKTVKQVLSEEVAGAKGKSKEEIVALQDRINQQLDLPREDFLSVLQEVLAGVSTGEEALAVLNPKTPQAALEVAEAAKAVPGGAVGSVGKAMEGTGQVLASVTSADSASRTALAAAIIGIHGKTLSREQEKELRDQIWAQGEINPNIAQSVVSDLLAGDETPEGAAARLEAPFKALALALQSGGASTQDFGGRLLKARPGMENSAGRKFGEALGSMLPLLAITLASGGSAAVAYNVAQNAGDAASAARKAGKDEHMQTMAAYSGIAPGLFGSIPFGRWISAPVVKAGATAFLKYVGLQAAVSGTQNVGQQALQNAIAKYFYEPDKSLMDGVAANFSAGAAITVMELAVRAMIKGAKLQNSPGSPPPGGGTARTEATVGEISKNAQESNLRQRDPETFRQFVDQATRNTPAESIYVPADQFVDYLKKRGIDQLSEIDRLGWISRSDLDAAIAAGGDLKIPTATYAAKIAGSEHDAFFTENARRHPADVSAKQASDPERRGEEPQKDAEDARVDQQAREAVEGTAKDAETARVNRKARRFVKEAPGDGEAVNVEERARRAVEGVDKDAEIAPVNGKARRYETKTSRNAASVDVNEQARRAVEGFDKGAEAARVNRKARRI